MTEQGKGTKKRKRRKAMRFASAFSMRFDGFSLDMLDRIAWQEDKSRPEVIRAAVKLLFLKKYGSEQLEELRVKHRDTSRTNREAD